MADRVAPGAYPRLPRLPLLGLTVAAPVLTWWAVGDQSSGPDYDFGPYHLSVRLEYLAGAVALVLAVGSLAVLVRATARGSFDLAGWRTITALVAAGAVGAASWRVVTAGAGGANIGGGFLVLVSPFIIAGLLVCAVAVAAHRIGRRRRAWPLMVAAVLTAPALFAVVIFLSYYDGLAGVATAQEVSGVHVGDSRSAVHDRLGRPLQYGIEQFFAPVAAPLKCEYYSEVADTPVGQVFQLCFAGSRLVSKSASHELYLR